MKSTRSPSSGMWSLRLGWGQSVPHKHAVRKFLDHLARERDDVAVGVLFPVQRRRTGDRQALGAADLAPDVLVIVHELEEALEFRTLDRLRHVRPAHVVDNDRCRQLGEEIRKLGQVRRLEIDDDMPVALDDALGDRLEFVHRREVDQPLDEIEAHAAHASLVQALQFGVGHVPPHGRDSTRPAVARKQSVDHRAVVGAMTGRLHDDVAVESEAIAQREQLRLAGVAGGVFAFGRVGELGPRSEHMAMRVDGAAWKRKAWATRPLAPVEPALRLLERPRDRLAAVFQSAFSRHI